MIITTPPGVSPKLGVMVEGEPRRAGDVVRLDAVTARRLMLAGRAKPLPGAPVPPPLPDRN